MKKVFIVFVIACVSTWTITSCGGKKEEAKTDKEDASDYAATEPEKDKSSGDDLISQGKALVDNSDCKTCHHATNKIIGPPHMDVAKKYEFTHANVSQLANKIIAGGSGVWGEIPMSPHPDISKADAEKMAMYVLSLDGEKLKD